MRNEQFYIRLEAKNPEKGPLRAYTIDAEHDLFGQWSIEVTYGRIGRRGRSVTYSAADDEGAAAIVRNCLHRRASAPRRIGIPYQIHDLVDPNEWARVQIS